MRLIRFTSRKVDVNGGTSVYGQPRAIRGLKHSIVERTWRSNLPQVAGSGTLGVATAQDATRQRPEHHGPERDQIQ